MSFYISHIRLLNAVALKNGFRLEEILPEELLLLEENKQGDLKVFGELEEAQLKLDYERHIANESKYKRYKQVPAKEK